MPPCFTINPLKKDMLFPLATMIVQFFNKTILTIIKQKVTEKDNGYFLLANSFSIILAMYIGESLSLIFFYIQSKNIIRINKRG